MTAKSCTSNLMSLVDIIYNGKLHTKSPYIHLYIGVFDSSKNLFYYNVIFKVRPVGLYSIISTPAVFNIRLDALTSFVSL